MKFYLAVFWFGLQQRLTYKMDIILTVVNHAVRFGAVLFLWIYILEDSMPEMSTVDWISYLLLTEGVSRLTAASWMRLGRNIIKRVKNGELSNYLIKPVNPVAFLYWEIMGTRIDMILSVVYIVISLLISRPESLLSVVCFVVTIICATLVSFGLNLIVGATSFWTTEAGGIKNAVAHIVRVLGGSMIPVFMFEDVLGSFVSNVIKYSPFPVTAFTPAYIIGINNIKDIDSSYLLAAVLWSVLLPAIAIKIWKKGLRRYEAVGI